MAVNKVIYYGEVLVDMSQVSVNPDSLVEGKTALDASGELITGSNPYEKAETDTEVSEQEALLDLALAALEGKVAGGGSGEPDNRALYQRVEFITADEDSYFVTDFVADNDSGMEAVASFPYFADHTFMGSRENSENTRFYVTYPLSATSSYFGFNTASKVSTSTLTINTIYGMQVNFLNSRLANVYDEAGNGKGSSAISGTLEAQSFPICIFRYNNAGTPTTVSRVLSLYSARCSRKNEVVREYIPCYRKADGVIGLYEKFTGQFLTNAGTGAFTKGADIDWEV